MKSMFADGSFWTPLLPLNGFLFENMRMNPSLKIQLNTLLNFRVIWGIYIDKVSVTLTVSWQLTNANWVEAEGTRKLDVVDSFLFRNLKFKTALEVGIVRENWRKTWGEVVTFLVKQYICSRDLAETKPGSLCSEVKCEGKHHFCFYSEIVEEEVIVQKGSAFELKMNTV